MTFTSAVDVSCIRQLNMTISGRVPTKDVTLWADACRTPPVERQCSIDSSKPDSTCVSALDQVISGSFPSTQIAEVERACHRIEASCSPRGNRKVSSSVDVGCVQQLYLKTSGKPSAATIATWIDSCRGQSTARCVIIGAKFNSACYSQSYQYMSGRPSVVEAATLARSCTTFDLQCE